MWELDCEESWAQNRCFWTVVLEKTLENPLDCKEIQPVHSEGDQPWDFFGRNDAKAEIPGLWPPPAKSWLIGRDPDAGRDWGQEEKGTTEEEMAGWHHWLNESEFEWTPGVGVGQGGLACCNSWGRKESDTTERLNWTEPIKIPQSLELGIKSSFLEVQKKGENWKWFGRTWFFVTPWTVAHQAPLSMKFSRQEYWSRLPFPSPGDLPDPGITPGSPVLQANSLPSLSPGKPHNRVTYPLQLNKSIKWWAWIWFSACLNLLVTAIWSWTQDSSLYTLK